MDGICAINDMWIVDDDWDDVEEDLVVLAASQWYLNSKQDGRNNRAPRSRVYQPRTNLYETIMTNPMYDDGWFRRYVRCHKASFLAMVDKVESKWVATFGKPLGHNSVFTIPERVLVTLYYFSKSFPEWLFPAISELDSEYRILNAELICLGSYLALCRKVFLQYGFQLGHGSCIVHVRMHITFQQLVIRQDLPCL